jgi:hypothetical protein
MSLRFKTRFRSETDDWTREGSSITSDGKLDAIRRELEDRGPVILEHRHYRGSSAPTWLVFSEYEGLCQYLEASAVAGDSLFLWSVADVCTVDRVLAEGKCPAEDGTVPRGGAY